MRTAGPSSANMHEVPAGVAQLAEQPSCKRELELPLTWRLAGVERILGRYSAKCGTVHCGEVVAPQCQCGTQAGMDVPSSGSVRTTLATACSRRHPNGAGY